MRNRNEIPRKSQKLLISAYLYKLQTPFSSAVANIVLWFLRLSITSYWFLHTRQEFIERSWVHRNVSTITRQVRSM